MANKVAELFADFRIAFNKGTLDIVNTTMGELRIGTLAEIASLSGLTKMLFNVGEHAMKTATNLHAIGKEYGFNTRWLQDYRRAGLAANVSTEDMDASAQSLQRTLANINLGQINQGFLQAAGFLGLRVGPGMTAKDVDTKLMTLVPQYIRRRGGGEIATAEAANLIEQLGLPRSMIQHFLGGKEVVPGKDLNTQAIEALTKTSEHLNTSLMNFNNYLSTTIEPIVDSLIPIGQALAVWASQFGAGITAAANAESNPGKVSDDFVSWAMSPLTYMTQSDAKAKEHEYLFSKRYPVQSRFFPPWLSGAGSFSEGKNMVPQLNSKTEINVYGVEDHKIARSVKIAGRDAAETHTRSFASAINHYNTQESGQSPKSTP